MSFLSAYLAGDPVYVETPVGPQLVMALALFDEGLSWADDGVLQTQPGHFPYHHLTGEIEWRDGDLVCDGHVFKEIPVVAPAELIAAWRWAEQTVTSMAQFHANRENDLRVDRLRISLASP